jgi:hypothetical protein
LNTLKITTHVCAYTGLAGQNAGGQTIHSLFPLSRLQSVGWNEEKAMPLNEEDDTPFVFFKPLPGVIFIDEISMVSGPMLDQILWLQKNIACKFVLAGDLLQLPPISTSRYVFESKSINEKFVIHELKECKRQNEQDFIDVIKNVGQNRFTHSVTNFLRERQAAFSQLTNRECSDIIYLFHDNKRVNDRNVERFSQLPTAPHLVGCIAISIVETIEFLGVEQEYRFGSQRESKSGLNFTDQENKQLLHELTQQHITPDLQLKVGCHIIFTRNLYNVKRCPKEDVKCPRFHLCAHQSFLPIRNGTRALVHAISAQSLFIQLQGETEIVHFPKQTIKLPPFQTRRSAKIKKGHLVRCIKGMYKGQIGRICDIDTTTGTVGAYCVHFLRDKDPSQTVSLTHWELVAVPRLKSYQFEVSCYPCTLSYALTISKAQGMTLDRIVLHLAHVPTASLMYVALSRCRSKNGVFVNGPFTAPRTGVDPKITQFLYSLRLEQPPSCSLHLQRQTNTLPTLEEVLVDLHPRITQFSPTSFQVDMYNMSHLVTSRKDAIRFIYLTCYRFCKKFQPQCAKSCTLQSIASLLVQRKRPRQ